MPKSLLDTTTYIDFQRARKNRREIWATNTLRHVADYIAQHGKLCLSTLTVMEIACGLTAQGHVQVFRQQIVPTFEIVGFNEDSACLAGEIYAKLDIARLRIGIPDTAVAAIALTHGLTLTTSNYRHFQRIVDLGYPLILENWRNP